MRLAVFQPDACPVPPQERLQALDTVLAENTSMPPDLVLCPELFVCGYGDAQAIRNAACPVDGELPEQLAQIAMNHSTAIACGYPEIDDGVLYNSMLCISKQGRLLANHRKRTLPTPYEQALFNTGNEATIFDLDHDWRVALLICYEVEFPEAVRACALADAHLVLAPTALGTDWGVVSRKVIPSRAFENNIFLAYSNYCGKDLNHHYIGESVIVSPMGEDLARAGTHCEIISADLDIRAIERARSRLPYLEDYPQVS